MVADDMGWIDLACYGNDFIETPNLDRMAARGIRFTDAYAAASLCSPSRAALMSGKHPVRVNITEHIHGNRPAGPNMALQTPYIDQALAMEHTTIAELLAPNGYETAFMGKWHLGGGKFAPDNRGFDLNIGGSFYGLPSSFFYPFFGEGAMPSIQDVSEEGDYLPNVLTDQALDFLSEKKDSTFLLYLAFYSPHVPIEAEEELVAKYEAKRAENPGDSLPNPHYAAMIEAIDRNVGRVLDKLDELGISEETLVIFTSDNGGLHVQEVPAFAKHTPPMKNDPLRAGKGYLYEGGIRVPYIAYWPSRIRGGQTNATPVIGQDLFNTLAELAGLPDRAPDGSSLVPLFTGDTIPDRSLVWHVPHYSPQGGKPASALRKGDKKLLYFYEDQRTELYDLSKDLSESNNLAGSNPDLARALLQELSNWKQKMNANDPQPNPAYEGQ